MVRTPYCDKSGLKKGTWTPEEDRKLVAYVSRYGCWNWRQLPKYAGLSRCGKSCRLRWMNYLRPNIKRGNYSEEEEETIIKLHESLGNKWSAIAAKLPGRTDNEIKNHWHTNLKKRLKQSSIANEAKGKAKDPPAPESSLSTHHLNLMNTQILESSPSSPQPSSSDQLSSITTDSTAISSKVSNNDVFFEPYAEPSGNFWTEPFLADNSYNFNVSYDFAASLVDTTEGVSLHNLFFDGDILFPYM